MAADTIQGWAVAASGAGKHQNVARVNMVAAPDIVPKGTILRRTRAVNKGSQAVAKLDPCANPHDGLCRWIFFDLDQRIAAAAGGDDGLGDLPPAIKADGVSAFHRPVHLFAGTKFRVPAKLIQQLESCIQNFGFLHFSPPGDQRFLVQFSPRTISYPKGILR